MIQVGLDTAIHLSKTNPEKFYYFKFSADWCGPCKQLGKLIDQMLILDNLPEITFLEIDADTMSNEQLDNWEVASVPTSVIVRGGEELGRKTGVPAKLALRDWIVSVMDHS